MNAFTSSDETGYHYSMPSNRLELWAYLESERFLHPVMREFYKERNVVIEERRMRTDSNPVRTPARAVHPARPSRPIPTIAPPSDGCPICNHFSATDAQKFFDKYYVPSNMVIAVAGDLKPAQAMPIVEKYFGRLPDSAAAGRNRDRRAAAEFRTHVVLLQRASQPIYIEGYHRPDYRSKDDAVFDAISDLMSEGRTSRLYRALVRDKKIASFSEGLTGFPGVKYPHLFAFLAVPLPGHTPDEMADSDPC